MRAFALFLSAAAVLLLVGWWTRSAGREAARPDLPPALLQGPDSTEPDSTEPEGVQAAEPAAPVTRTEVVPEALAGPEVQDSSGRAFEARIVDERAQPIEGARLVAPGFEGAREAASGGDGHARLVLPWSDHASSRLTLQARGPGRVHRSLRVEGTMLAGDGDVYLGEVVLGSGGAVEGLVRSADGSPAVEAWVYASSAIGETSGTEREELEVWGRTAWPELGDGIRPRVQTDADGRYLLEGIPVGQVAVLAFAPGTLTAHSPRVAVAAGVTRRIEDLILTQPDPEHLIRGTVQEPDGTPFAGATLRVMNPAGSAYYPVFTAPSAEDGAFRVLAPRERALSLEFYDPERRWPPVTVGPVRAGDHGVVARFTGDERIVVLVRDRLGNPVEHADLDAWSDDGRRLSSRARTDAPGRYSLILPAEAFSVRCFAPGYLPPDRQGPFESDAPPEEIVFALERANGFRGRVTRGGEPVPGAEVHAHSRFQRDGIPMGTFRQGLVTRVEPRASARTECDGEGNFFLPVVVSGDYELHASSAGGARAVSPLLSFEQGGDVEGLHLELPRAGTIEGRVRTAEGADPGGVIVAAGAGDGHLELTRTDPAGRFRFESLAPGAWQVRRILPAEQRTIEQRYTWPWREREGEVTWDLELAPGATATFDIDLSHEVPSRLVGTLLVDGAPARGWSAGMDRERTQVDAQGTFRLEAREPGRVWIRLQPPSSAATLASFGRPVDLVEGENRLLLEIPTASLELLGLVAPAPDDLTDEPPSYALLWSGPDDLRWEAFPRLLDEGGRWRLPVVPAGRLTLKRRPEDQGGWSPQGWSGEPLLELDLEAGEERVVKVDG